ncbi:MAG: hypothetical protein JST84_04945 [Acidobacteria bacterium]|nr:hypothetical protein [Acidobacteriota bacterium]
MQPNLTTLTATASDITAHELQTIARQSGRHLPSACIQWLITVHWRTLSRAKAEGAEALTTTLAECLKGYELFTLRNKREALEAQYQLLCDEARTDAALSVSDEIGRIADRMIELTQPSIYAHNWQHQSLAV